MARMRKKKNLLPRMERAGVYQVTDPAALRGRWRSALNIPAEAELLLELGCGKGAFALKTAQAGAGCTYCIALDKVKEALVIGMERAFAADETGSLPLRFIAADCLNLRDIFAPGEVDVLCINFCDPWPNKQRYKRRITWDGFLQIYTEILKPGGHLRFKTDNEPLYDFTLERLAACGYTLTAASRNLHSEPIPNITTEYEDKFTALGMPIYFADSIPPKKEDTADDKKTEV